MLIALDSKHFVRPFSSKKNHKKTVDEGGIPCSSLLLSFDSNKAKLF